MIPLMEILLLYVCVTSEPPPWNAPVAAPNASNHSALDALSSVLGFAESGGQSGGAGGAQLHVDWSQGQSSPGSQLADQWPLLGGGSMRCLEAQTAYIAEFLPGKALVPILLPLLPLPQSCPKPSSCHTH